MNPPRPLAHWRIELLGGIRAVSGATVLTRFGSRKITALLARLALSPQRQHAREELIDLLWPQADAATGRNRLRQALSTLKRLLQPPGAGEVLFADRTGIRVNPLAVSCDVLDFEACARDGRAAQARQLYRGELLPGLYDDWVQEERQRLQAIFERLDVATAEQGAAAAVPAMPGVGVTLFPNRQMLLPSYLSAFFGRERERRELAALLQTHRLVTLSGAGGSGKTRLAIEVARDLAPRFETVLFVGLAELDRPEAIGESIRQSLRLAPSGQETEAQLVDYLSERDALVVLDNFEQLVEPGGVVVVERLLGALPRLRCLVTSRRVLLIAGERELALAPLPLPTTTSPAELAEVSSVALFVDRARGARPEFQVTARNGADLAQLSRALEGLPLAIELAAARVRAMSVAEMAREIGLRRDWLSTARPLAAREPRHASLRAAVDWSWRLLEPQQQRFLGELTVLRGGWTAEAAAAVTAVADARARLDSLVGDSLLQTQTDAWGSTRFSMLETIREFVAEQVGAGTLAVARARHRRHFLDAVRRSARLESTRLALDEANVEQALASAVDDGELMLAQELAAALRPFADARGLDPRIVERLRQLAAAVAAADGGACRIHMLLAEALTIACRLDEAVRHGQLAVETAATELQRAEADFVLARASWDRYLTALAHRPALERALAVAQAAGACHLQARVLNLLGTIALQDQRDLDAAEALYRKGVELARRCGLRRLAAQGSFNLGILYRRRRRFVDGVACCDEVIDDCRQRGDLTLLADALHERGLALIEMRRWRESVGAMVECVDFCWRHRALISLLYALWNMARPLARTGGAMKAARLIGFSAAYWEQHGGPLSVQDRRYVRRVQRLAAAAIGHDAAAAALREGAGLALPAAVELALCAEAS